MGARPSAELKAAREAREVARLKAETRVYQAREKMAGQVVALADSYGGARRSRLNQRTSALASGQAHRDRSSREQIGRDAEALMRSDPQARAMVQRRIDLVVGSGPSLQVETDDEKWNEKTERYLTAWADGDGLVEEDGRLIDLGPCEVRGLLGLDDIGAGFEWASAVWGDVAALKLAEGSLQIIESPRIINPNRKQDDEKFRGGIEVDGVGRPVALHVGEWNKGGTYIEGKTTSRPWEHVLFYANPEQNRSDAWRGEAQLAASLNAFESLGKYKEAVRAAARMGAIFGLAVKTERPADMQLALAGETVDSEGVSGEQQREIAFAPGMGLFLRPGESIDQIKPEQPGTNVEQFIFSELMPLGADQAIPLFLSVLDGRQVNLASLRAMVRVIWRNVERRQTALDRRLYRPVYTWKVAQWMRMGLIEFRPDWRRHTWVFPPAPMMDEAQELEGATRAWELRLKSLSTICRELYGRNWRREFDRIKADMLVMRAEGLEPVSKPGAKQAGDESREHDEKPDLEDDADPRG